MPSCTRTFYATNSALLSTTAVMVGILSMVGLTGCASVRAVDARVHSYSTLSGLPEPATYRLELLPSQQAQAVQFDAIEQQAEHALSKVGLRRIKASATHHQNNAHFIVHINAQAYATLPEFWPYGLAERGWSWGWGAGMGPYRGRGWHLDHPPTLQHRAVSIVMRDAHTQTVVYETAASHEEVWSNDALIFGVLFDAALNGFPQPPSGARQIRREIPVP